MGGGALSGRRVGVMEQACGWDDGGWGWRSRRVRRVTEDDGGRWLQLGGGDGDRASRGHLHSLIWMCLCTLFLPR